MEKTVSQNFDLGPGFYSTLKKEKLLVIILEFSLLDFIKKKIKA